MNKLFFLVGFLFLFTFGNAQVKTVDNDQVERSYACKCKTLFDSCTISCPPGTLPSCGSTWYGGCHCECEETVVNPGTGMDFVFYINEVQLLKEFIKDQSKIDILEEIISEMMENKFTDDIFIAKNDEEQIYYFNKLTNLFYSLTPMEQEQFHLKLKI